ncbi:NmrA family NAD(P)-binding protein [Zunongwangia sp. F363]|uniref:NmrA family NAD(P)-binding protein n=1 Tax=Autumnicola tepida TaxID=3075595 RepID=A0ABU3CC66_9FLAO|nr:NmrA family NAD(P)-binding protein [Zunongwangia sp. F363]MDT0643929.1 NmrA family NAD(P)-binding protein [Zunongwangia sp. F363]
MENSGSERKQNNPENSIAIAGATGALGHKIARHLVNRGAKAQALVRKQSSAEKINQLEKAGVQITFVDYENQQDLVQACRNVSCVVSALSGLEDVIIDTQGKILDAALIAGVPRFIPSDYSIDFTKISEGTNRNLDLRKIFHDRINKTTISATSILNGMFTDLLTGQAPLILNPVKRVIYWGDKHQPLDFTTMEDTAAFTASAALDPDTPRYLRISGEISSPEKLKNSASAAKGENFKLFRIGGIKTLDNMIKFTQFVSSQKNEVFPPWQGMQYLRNMLSGNAKLEPLNNERYGKQKWSSVREVLEIKNTS